MRKVNKNFCILFFTYCAKPVRFPKSIYSVRLSNDYGTPPPHTPPPPPLHHRPMILQYIFGSKGSKCLEEFECEQSGKNHWQTRNQFFETSFYRWCILTPAKTYILFSFCFHLYRLEAQISQICYTFIFYTVLFCHYTLHIYELWCMVPLV